MMRFDFNAFTAILESRELMNPRQRIGQIVTTLASLAGIPISITLLLIHVRTKVGDTSGVAQLCGESDRVDCSVAAASGYSEIMGVPIAAIGLAFYLAVLLVTVIASTLNPTNATEDEARTPAFVVFVAYSLALLDSVYLGFVNFTQLDKICDKCIWLYAINTVGFLASGVWAAGNPVRAASEGVRRIPATALSAAAAVLVLTFISGVGGSLWQVNRLIEASAEQPKPVLVLAPSVNTEALYRADAPSVGPEDAAIQIVEFSDFECPYCARFAETVAELKEAYPTQVRVQFRNYPLSFHPNARLVARMAVCAKEQNRFWEFHDRAFALQGSLYKDFSADTLVKLAEDVGMNGEEARDCLNSSFSETSVERDVTDGRTLEIRGTPSVFINGRAYSGPLDLASLRSVIDTLIEEPPSE